jgi:hypothetical protein
MTTDTRRSWLLTTLLCLAECGPEASQEPELDPEETITAFCETLFACPEEEAMATYGSLNGCKDVHWRDYEERNPTCREIVLVLEDCLAGLNCDELEDSCSDWRLRLGREACAPL